MPIPMLRVRYSSPGSRPVASSRTSANSGGDGQDASSIRASTPDGSTRGTFSTRPPPVMWARALTLPVGEDRLEHAEVAAVRLEEGVAERAIEPGRGHIEGDPLEQPPEQRVPVGVRPTRRHADEDVTGGHIGAREQRGPLGDPHQGARDIERAGRVHAGHLGGLAAEERAPGRLARLGHAGDDVGDDVGVEAAGGEVVEEEKRPRRLHQHIVDAVVDDVVADPAQPSGPGRELDLRADSVRRRHQHRVVHRRDRLGREDPAEAPDPLHDLGAVGPLDGDSDLVDGAGAGIDVDAGRGVRAQLGAGRPPADVPAHLHPFELDLGHRLVRRGAGGGEIGRRDQSPRAPAHRSSRRRPSRPGTPVLAILRSSRIAQ